ncbi:hypothetical protein COCMIDRAFT_29809 [Bipolaris oryzae ATCC 44560]|uniref:Uncharacterized protein n=1 Tax=Bipolaris oryzae ATCC 44560 TaxID=930090 RepID=W6YV39_COCMI|nr:uncharacterized protein COCMIDRAFT_29809 [Bipolaris oryzae ATCC 44560]EUC41413.1 hypothetical protein COCMIDRAFT_29809 [Bipolaris oryzae ATCC 44560]
MIPETQSTSAPEWRSRPTRAGTWVVSLLRTACRGRHHVLSQGAGHIGQPSLPPRFLYTHLQAQSLVHVPSACRGQGGMSTDPDLLPTWQPWLGHGVVAICLLRAASPHPRMQETAFAIMSCLIGCKPSRPQSANPLSAADVKMFFALDNVP